MLSVKNKGILLQIILRCDRIGKVITKVDFANFSKDMNLVEVVCFNLFQIGELVNHLSIDIRNKYSKIPWHYIVAMRNRIVHGYDTIDIEIVWNTINSEITSLSDYCKKIIEIEDNIRV